MINSYGGSQSDLGSAKDGTVDSRTHIVTWCGRPALTARAELCNTLRTTHIPESLPGSSFSCRSVSGWKGKRTVCSPPSQCPTCQQWGLLSQERKSLMLFLSQEVLKNLPGSRFHGLFYHPDAGGVSREELLPRTSWNTPSCFAYSLIVTSNLWAAQILLFSTYSHFFL